MDFLAEMRRDPRVQEALLAAAMNPKSRNFGAAMKVLTDYDDERPAKRLDLSHLQPLTDEERAAKIKSILARVAKEQG